MDGGDSHQFVGTLSAEGAAMLERGDCPIKREFLVPSWTVPPQLPEPEPVVDGAKEEEEEQPASKNEWGDKKQRRSRKQQPKNQAKKNPWLSCRAGMVPRLGPELCMAFVEGACVYGDKCKFNHDLDKFFAQKPPNVDMPCHVFATFGYCPDGIKCRFSQSHTKEGGRESIVDAERYAPFKAAREAKWPVNQDLLYDLVKGRVKLERAQAVADAYKKEMARRGAAEKAKSSGAEAEQKRSKVDAADDEGAVWAALAVEKRKPLDFTGKLYLAPLTTNGNLPFRRLCVELGCDVTIGEMAVAQNVREGKRSEWALMKRHTSEKFFGVQLAGAKVDDLCLAAQVVEDHVKPDFIDLNCGCPIDVITEKGMGSALLDRITRLRDICYGLSRTLVDTPFSIKVRTGKKTGEPTIHRILPELYTWGCSAITIHGRSREQRYTKTADWDYIRNFASQSPIPVVGNGDCWDYGTFHHHLTHDKVATVMFARGALIKPWVFTECKERRHWDISSSERLDLLRKFANYGLEHWGSDWEGVEKCRNFLLQSLSFMHRYVPVGVLERFPVDLTCRPIPFVGRDELETRMASPYSEDWIAISEMLLGKVPDGFKFQPKHASNSYVQSVMQGGQGAPAPIDADDVEG